MSIRLAENFSADIRLNKIRRLIWLSLVDQVTNTVYRLLIAPMICLDFIELSTKIKKKQ